MSSTHRQRIGHWVSAALAAAAVTLAGCQLPGVMSGAEPRTDVAVSAADGPALAAYRKAMGLLPVTPRPASSAWTDFGFRVAQVLGADYLYGPPMTLTNVVRDQQYPAVAYNSVPTPKTYLSVWEDYRNGATNSDLYAQLISATGILSGTNLAVSTAAGYQLGPRIAFNATAVGGNFLVAWTDTRNGTLDVYAQLVNAAGNPINGAGTIGQSPVLMASGTGNQILHALEYHPAANQFLLTWIDDVGGSSVLKGCRVSALNAKVGADITISATGGALAGGGLAVNNSTGNYLVAWGDARTTAPGVYTRQVSQTGTFPTAEAVVASGAGFDYLTPKLAYNPINPIGFMLTYEIRSTTTGDSDVRARVLSSTGAATGLAIAVAPSTGHQTMPVVSCNRAVGNYLVTWSDGRAGANELDLYGKMFTASGGVLVNEWTVNNGTNLQAMPAVAYDSTKKLFMTLWQDARTYGTNGFEIMTQRVLSTQLTAQDLIGEMSEYLDAYYPGPSNGANSARSHLDNALAKIAAGDYAGAINHINTYKDRVTSLHYDGFITAEELAGLIAVSNAAIAAIQAGSI